ncbi:MAG: glycosyltransferase family 4 protein [Nanoarchaeota archaeon]|nr:glycosyltransferase family 4 protein [Nanoarchaeota archaeon]
MSRFIQIVPDIGKGCSPQISRKEDYHLNPALVMQKLGYTAEFWTLRRGAEGANEQYYGVPVRRFKSSARLLLALLFAKDVALVYTHLRPFLPALLAPFTFKRCVLTPHTYELGSTPLIRRVSVFCMRRFKAVIALTPYEQELYLKNGMRSHLLPHGIDWQYFSHKPERTVQAIRKQYGVKPGDFVVTSVSNFRKFKNVDSIVRAFDAFHKEMPSSVLLVAGLNQIKNAFYEDQARYQGHEDPEQTANSLKLREEIKFTGGLGYAEVRDVFAITDVFVNNSDPETMGLSVYEAASHGVALCLSDIGSFRTVFGDLACYAKPRDVDGIKKVFLDYAKDKELREGLGEELTAFAEAYDVPVFLKRLEAFYRKILS